MPADNGKEEMIDVELVRKLADLLAESGLTEIEVERGGLKIRVARSLTVAEVDTIPAISASVSPAALPAPRPAATAVPAEPRGELVKSPMVGTVYLQANPGDPPFVQPGSMVAAGQTLLIIDAMKTMNPIPAPRAGKVREVLVDDEQPVEFGEPLVVLE